MRKLATIQRISAIRPIPGADKIEVADVLGWSVVVGKDEFKVGDLAVYFEIDSWLDATNPAFASFEERFVAWGTKRGMRLKTIKLRKQISQGLLMPISAFSELVIDGHTTHEPAPAYWAEGVDVTEILKIEKWEALEEANTNNGSQASFPSFIFKTDQERIQNLGSQLPQHKDETFEVSIKLDGSSMTVYHLNDGSPFFEGHYAKRTKNKKLSWWQRLKRWVGWDKKPGHIQGVCSRNCELEADGGSLFAQVARDAGVFAALENFDLNYALQGELIAPSIQQNHEQVGKPEFYIFDVFDIDNQCYLLPEEARSVVEDLLGLDYVPVISQAFKMEENALYEASLSTSTTPRRMVMLPTWEDPRKMVDALLDIAEGPGMNEGVKREGLVFKSNHSGFSFKAISNSYLLKKESK